jgi:hypothetical protein
VDGEVACGGRNGDVAVLQPVEQSADRVVGLGDVSVQGHGRLRLHCAHESASQDLDEKVDGVMANARADGG